MVDHIQALHQQLRVVAVVQGKLVTQTVRDLEAMELRPQFLVCLQLTLAVEVEALMAQVQLLEVMVVVDKVGAIQEPLQHRVRQILEAVVVVGLIIPVAIAALAALVS